MAGTVGSREPWAVNSRGNGVDDSRLPAAAAGAKTMSRANWRTCPGRLDPPEVRSPPVTGLWMAPEVRSVRVATATARSLGACSSTAPSKRRSAVSSIGASLRRPTRTRMMGSSVGGMRTKPSASDTQYPEELPDASRRVTGTPAAGPCPPPWTMRRTQGGRVSGVSVICRKIYGALAALAAALHLPTSPATGVADVGQESGPPYLPRDHRRRVGGHRDRNAESRVGDSGVSPPCGGHGSGRSDHCRTPGGDDQGGIHGAGPGRGVSRADRRGEHEGTDAARGA